MQRRKATVELFEEIRREYEFGVGRIQGVARKFGVGLAGSVGSIGVEAGGVETDEVEAGAR